MYSPGDTIKADMLARYLRRRGVPADSGYIDFLLELERLLADMKVLERVGVDAKTKKLKIKRSICYNGEDLAAKVLTRLKEVTPLAKLATAKVAVDHINLLIDSGILARSIEYVLDPELYRGIVDLNEYASEIMRRLKKQYEKERLMRLTISLLDEGELKAIVKHLDVGSKDKAVQSAAAWLADCLLEGTSLFCLTQYEFDDEGGFANQTGDVQKYVNSKGREMAIDFLKSRGYDKADAVMADKWLDATAKRLGLETATAAWALDSGPGVKQITVSKPQAWHSLTPTEDAKRMVRYLQTYAGDLDEALRTLWSEDLGCYELSEENITKALVYLRGQQHKGADRECAILWLRFQGKKMDAIFTRSVIERRKLFPASSGMDAPTIERHLACFGPPAGKSQAAEDWLKERLDGLDELFAYPRAAEFSFLKRWRYYDCAWDTPGWPSYMPVLWGTGSSILLRQELLDEMRALVACTFLPIPENIDGLVRYLSVYEPVEANRQYAERWLTKRRQALKQSFTKARALQKTHGRDWPLVELLADNILKVDRLDQLDDTSSRKYLADVDRLNSWLYERQNTALSILDEYATNYEITNRNKTLLVRYLAAQNPSLPHKDYAELWLYDLSGGELFELQRAADDNPSDNPTTEDEKTGR